MSLNNCGQEAGFRTISFVSSEYCDLSGFYLGANQIKSDNIKRDAYIYIGEGCRAITLKNVRHYLNGRFIKVEGFYNDPNVPKLILENIGGPWGIGRNSIDVQKNNIQYVELQGKRVSD